MGIVLHGKIFWLDCHIKGKRYRRSLHTNNKFEALHLYGKKREELIQEKTGKRIRLSEFIQKYLDWAWNSKPASADREQQRLKKIKEFFDGQGIIYLQEISTYHLEQFRIWLKGMNRSQATINRYLQILRGIFYRAEDWGFFLGPNPAKKIKFYRETTQPRQITKNELEKIIEAAEAISKKPRSKLQACFPDLIQVAVHTGMRKSEILNMKWNDIKENVVEVRGKGDRIRMIPLNEMARRIIEKQPKRGNFIFNIPNRNQGGLFRRTIDTIKKRTNIDFNFHALRHYFTTELLGLGADLITVSELLGHSKKTMTTLIYSHTNMDRKKKAVNLLGPKADTDTGN